MNETKKRKGRRKASRKGRCVGPPKARRLRLKRKLAKARGLYFKAPWSPPCSECGTEFVCSKCGEPSMIVDRCAGGRACRLDTDPPQLCAKCYSRKALTEDAERGSGPPVRNVLGFLGVIRLSSGLGATKYAWGDRPCGACGCQRQASMSVTWEHWHRGRWRKARRYRCVRHSRSLKARLGRVK